MFLLKVCFHPNPSKDLNLDRNDPCVLPAMKQKPRQSCSSQDDMLTLFALAQASMTNNGSVYHNKRHLEDVVHFVEEAIVEAGTRIQCLRETRGEWNRVITAAAYMHDVYHPAGQEHNTEHNTIEDITKYVTGKLPTIDTSLEEMHSVIGTTLISRQASHAKLPQMERSFRIQIISELIMSTSLDTYMTPQTIDFKNPEKDMKEVARVLVRCADLSHFTFNLPNHLERVKALGNEIGHEVSSKENLDFIKTVVLPQFEMLDRICQTPRSKEWLMNVRFKMDYWSQLNDQDQDQDILIELI